MKFAKFLRTLVFTELLRWLLLSGPNIKISSNTLRLKLYGLVKENLVQAFSCEFYKISRNTFSAENLWAIASVILKV